MTAVKLNFELEDKKPNVKTDDIEEAAKRFTTSLLFLIRTFGVSGVSVKIVGDDGDESVR